MALSWLRSRRRKWIAITLAVLWLLEMGLLVWYLLPDDAGAPPPTTTRDGGIAAGAELPAVAPTSTSTATASPTPPSTRGPTARATTLAQSYPTTVDAYARAALNAWLAGGGARLADLATAEAVKAVGRAPAGLAGGWQFYSCRVEPIKPCRQLRNDDGDVFSVSVDRARLGQARAVTAAYRDLTRYEGSALGYLYRGIDAWNAANTERASALTDGQGGWIFTTIAARGDHAAFHDYVEFASTNDPGNRTCIQAWDSTGTSWLWAVDKRRLGQPRAIVWAGAEQVC
jgi:hypothetical protein